MANPCEQSLGLKETGILARIQTLGDGPGFTRQRGTN
jgi:hypothetical protein